MMANFLKKVWFWCQLGAHQSHNASVSTFELYTYTKTVADAFLPHCFIKRKQAEQYELDKVQAQKENSNGMVFQMDDAENYTHSAVGEGRTFRRAKIQF